VAEKDTPMVHVYDARSGSDEPLESFQLHNAPVAVMRFNAAHDTVISVDLKGESWFVLVYILALHAWLHCAAVPVSVFVSFPDGLRDPRGR
jgi:hypothetical protein